jgi:thiosulfate reductase/polysulfide reductase chain A
MVENRKGSFTRRTFLKLTGATAATTALGNRSRVLHALTASADSGNSGSAQKIFSTCDMCFNKCGLIARVDAAGIAKKLDPNPKFTKSRGMLCARGNAGIAQLYDPDRLKYPLLRTGSRGEGKWQRLTWDQALDHAAERLSKIASEYTRCGVLFMAGSDLQTKFVRRFAEVFGSFNVISHESNCLLSRNRAFIDTFGVVPEPDILHCKYVIMAGANRFEALVTPDSIDMMTALKNGSKLVVLDPRYTKTAALATEWHPIKPGTDMAFFLAIAHVIISEEKYDKQFIADKTFGFDQLKQHVRNYTPEWAETECEIPAKDIVRIARELADAAPASMVYPGRRTSDYEDSSQIRRAFAIVNALLGNWDKPGGLTIPLKLKGGSIPADAPWYDDNPEERIEVGRSSMMFEEEGSFKHARDAVIEGKPYPVKGFVNYKTNPMATGANRKKTIEMINKLDFMLTIDIAMSDTAWMADLVLPAPSYLERKDPIAFFHGASAGYGAAIRNQVVKPLFESKPVFWIMKELAKRLDLGEHFDFSMDDFRKAQLKKLPDVRKALESDGVYVKTETIHGRHEGKKFKTHSKKIELYNQRYKDAGIDPMPVYRSPRHVPDGQFRLVVGRNAYITQGSTTNNALLAELIPENTLWLHPRSAATIGVVEKDNVEVSSFVGKGTLQVRLTREIRPDTVYMASGFGVLSKGLTTVYGKGASIVDILEDYNDEMTGNMAMHETFVSIKKV